MNRSLRTACLLLVTTFAALPLTGCVVKADVEAETLVRFEGTPQSQDVAYASGQDVRIVSHNGQVDVVPSSSGQVEVTFSPFTMNKESEEDTAVREMQEELRLSISAAGEILVEVGVGANASGYLGADIRVGLPSTFDGDFAVEQNNGGVDVDLASTAPLSTSIQSGNGSIDVMNAGGRLDIFTDNGSVEVDVDTWSTENGAVVSGNGSITFALPGAVDGKMTCSADQVIEEGTIPATWATAGEGGAKSYTMGTGVGGQVDIATDLGDITIVIK